MRSEMPVTYAELNQIGMAFVMADEQGRKSTMDLRVEIASLVFALAELVRDGIVITWEEAIALARDNS